VKHKSLKSEFALPNLDDKAVNSTTKIFLNTYRNILLCLIIKYCLVQQCVYQLRVHKFEELLAIWHGLQQSAVDSATDGEHAFAPVYRPKKNILSSVLTIW